MKKIKIKVYPNSKEEKVLEDGDVLKIYVKERAEKGMANKKVLELIKKRFGKEGKIIKGKKSRNKVVVI